MNFPQKTFNRSTPPLVLEKQKNKLVPKSQKKLNYLYLSKIPAFFKMLVLFKNAPKMIPVPAAMAIINETN